MLDRGDCLGEDVKPSCDGLVSAAHRKNIYLGIGPHPERRL